MNGILRSGGPRSTASGMRQSIRPGLDDLAGTSPSATSAPPSGRATAGVNCCHRCRNRHSVARSNIVDCTDPPVRVYRAPVHAPDSDRAGSGERLQYRLASVESTTAASANIFLSRLADWPIRSPTDAVRDLHAGTFARLGPIWAVISSCGLSPSTPRWSPGAPTQKRATAVVPSLLDGRSQTSHLVPCWVNGAHSAT